MSPKRTKLALPLTPLVVWPTSRAGEFEMLRKEGYLPLNFPFWKRTKQ